MRDEKAIRAKIEKELGKNMRKLDEEMWKAVREKEEKVHGKLGKAEKQEQKIAQIFIGLLLRRRFWMRWETRMCKVWMGSKPCMFDRLRTLCPYRIAQRSWRHLDI